MHKHRMHTSASTVTVRYTQTTLTRAGGYKVSVKQGLQLVTIRCIIAL